MLRKGIVALCLVWLAVSILQILIYARPVYQLIRSQVVYPELTDEITVAQANLIYFFSDADNLARADYSDTEYAHIVDIKKLLRTITVLWQILLAFIFVSVAIMMHRRWKYFFSDVVEVARIFFMALVILTATVAIFFEPIFMYGHTVFFPGGNWQFDPGRHLIIQIYPPDFFTYFFGAWAVLSLVCCAIIIGASYKKQKLRPGSGQLVVKS